LKKKLAPSEYPSNFATIREIVDFPVPAIQFNQKIHLPSADTVQPKSIINTNYKKIDYIISNILFQTKRKTFEFICLISTNQPGHNCFV
jgi:hypothetical protein